MVLRLKARPILFFDYFATFQLTGGVELPITTISLTTNISISSSPRISASTSLKICQETQEMPSSGIRMRKYSEAHWAEILRGRLTEYWSLDWTSIPGTGV